MSTITTSIASGSTDTFPLGFDYIDDSHVEVRLDGVLKTVVTHYNVVGSNVVFVGGNVTAGVEVERRRVTPVAPLVVFQPGALDEDDLNLGLQQTRYISEEAREAAQQAEAAAEAIEVDLDEIAAAAGHASDAEAAKNLAQEWAENPEDDDITGSPGSFSALHWAAKALAAAQSVISGIAGLLGGLSIVVPDAAQDHIVITDGSDSNNGKRSTLATVRDLFRTSSYDAIFQTIAGMSSYQTVAGMSSYMPNDDVVSVAPSASQNNYATGLATSRAQSVLNIAPTVSVVITGISTSSWVTNKRAIIRNSTANTGSTGRLIIFPRNSSLSSAANRIQYPGNKRLPLVLMPGESMEVIFDGTDLKVISAPRGYGMHSWFDSLFDGLFNFGSWVSGTGASESYAGQGSDENSEPYHMTTLSTGTTTTGRAALVDNDATIRAGAGCLMFLARVNVPVLSDGTDEYDATIGFLETGAAPTDMIAWQYDRNSATDWRVRSISNGAATGNTVTGFPVVAAGGAGGHPVLGLFVNGDGTRAEGFYSVDGGVTWAVTSPLTSNIPNTTARLFGFGASIVKSAGTTARTLRVIFAGMVGWQ